MKKFRVNSVLLILFIKNCVENRREKENLFFFCGEKMFNLNWKMTDERI